MTWRGEKPNNKKPNLYFNDFSIKKNKQNYNLSPLSGAIINKKNEKTQVFSFPSSFLPSPL